MRTVTRAEDQSLHAAVAATVGGADRVSAKRGGIVTKGQAPKRDHHILPRAYLKGFTDPTSMSHVWVYSRGGSFDPVRTARSHRSPRLQAIRRAGAKRDFYAYETLSGETVHNQVEDGLELQEEACLAALTDIRLRKPIDTAAKHRFSSYVRMMLMRVPHREKWAAPIFDETLDSFPWDDLTRRAAEEGRFREARRLALERDDARRDLQRELLLRSLVEPVVRAELASIDKAIGTMTWHLFVAPPQHYFVTTDNPVSFTARPIGLMDARSWLVFPISNRVALVARMLHPADRIYVDATQAQVDFLNRLILAGADELGYACKAERWVVDAWVKPFSEAELAEVTAVMQPPAANPV